VVAGQNHKFNNKSFENIVNLEYFRHKTANVKYFHE